MNEPNENCPDCATKDDWCRLKLELATMTKERDEAIRLNETLVHQIDKYIVATLHELALDWQEQHETLKVITEERDKLLSFRRKYPIAYCGKHGAFVQNNELDDCPICISTQQIASRCAEIANSCDGANGRSRDAVIDAIRKEFNLGEVPK